MRKFKVYNHTQFVSSLATALTRNHSQNEVNEVCINYGVRFGGKLHRKALEDIDRLWKLSS